MRAGDYAECYASAEASAAWHDLDAPATPVFPWDPASTYLRPPPFVRADGGDSLGRYRATPLLVLGDDITTAHLSQIGRAHVRTPVTNAHLVCRLPLEKKKPNTKHLTK